MTTFDPSVWTSDDVPTRGFYWVRSREGMDRVQEFFAGDIHHARSILPIPSAEEIAALVGLERAVLDAVTGAPTSQPERYEGDNHGDSFSSGWDSGEFSMAKKLRAALARLDAARKERGA